MDLLEIREARLALSLLLGLLLGVERERRKRERGVDGIAGLRTFALAGLLGGVTTYLDVPYAVAAGALVLGALIVVGYALDSNREQDKGLTTEIALFLTFVLGALALDHPAVAAIAAIAATLLLHLRRKLHHFVGDVLRDDELQDGLLILVFAFVGLPLAPDTNIGPYAAINPHAIVRLMFAVTLISSGGYVAQRLFGARLGLVTSGFASGFVSSTATITALGLRAKQEPNAARAAAAGGIASSIATVLQYAAVVAAVDPALLAHLGWPLGSALLAACAMTALLARAARAAADPAAARKGRAFQILPALAIGAGSVVVAVLAAALSDWIGDAGIVVVSSVSGVVDAHATTGSIATLHRGGRLDPNLAVLALVAALSTNTVTKIGVASISGPRDYALRIAAGVTAIALAAWLGLVVGGLLSR